MHVLIVHKPSFIKNPPFCHLRLFAIMNLTISEYTLETFPSVILQITQNYGNSKELMFLKLLSSTTVSTRFICSVKQVGQLKTKIFYLIVASFGLLLHTMWKMNALWKRTRQDNWG